MIKPIFNNLLLVDINQLIFPMKVPKRISDFHIYFATY